MSEPDKEPQTLGNSFIRVSPAGCYYAVESHEKTVVRTLLHKILCNAVTPAFSDYAGTDLQKIFELAKSGFIHLSEHPVALPDGSLSDLMPKVLPALSERERVVLTEARQGLFLDFTGMSQSEAEELAVFAAGLRSLSNTHTSLLTSLLGTPGNAMGVVDPAGNSDIGFWPLHISDNVLTLIILGIPRFNSVEFGTLVWALIERYGSKDPA